MLVDPEVYGIDRDELLQELNAVGIQTRPLWGLNPSAETISGLPGLQDRAGSLLPAEPAKHPPAAAI